MKKKEMRLTVVGKPSVFALSKTEQNIFFQSLFWNLLKITQSQESKQD